MKKGSILIGTSGWLYDSWREKFYPAGMSNSEKLAFYSSEFPTVEINNSFYKVPSTDTYKKWSQTVPKGFVFALKASRFLTHNKKLKDPLEPWKRVLAGPLFLRSKRGPILLQFPPMWRKNETRLEEFLHMAKANSPRNTKLVFEFRNETWFSDDILDLLKQFHAALCIADSHKFKRSNAITAGFTFIRYHGRSDYRPKYSDKELQEEAQFIKDLSDNRTDVYVYFNNDTRGYAIDNARTLRNMLERKGALLKAA